MRDILVLIEGGELHQVHAELLDDYWSQAQFAAAVAAIEELINIDWVKDGIGGGNEDVAPTSFNDIAVEIGKVDWDAIWCATRTKHVTRPVKDLSC